MSTLSNRVNLIGRIGTELEIRDFGEGKRLAKFQFATSSHFKNAKGENAENTEWHNVVIWGRLVEPAERLFKVGQELAIEGKIHYRTYENADGKKQFYTEIQVNEFLMLRPGSQPRSKDSEGQNEDPT